MPSNLYNKFFDKDKPLRHVTQHFLIGFSAFFLLSLFSVETTVKNFVYFIFYTYIVDLDGLLSIFIFKGKIKEAEQIVNSLKSKKFLESATLSTIHHKKLNRLLIHNVVGLFLIGLVFLLSIVNGGKELTLATWAILSHFIFDIADDLYQLKHIRNWLWPLFYLSKYYKHTS